MNGKDISQAKNPDLRGSYPALCRAAELARKTAIQTGTNLVVFENGQLLLIPPEDLIEKTTGNCKGSQDQHSTPLSADESQAE